MKGSLVALLVLLLAALACAERAEETGSAETAEPAAEAAEIADDASAEPSEEDLLNRPDPTGVYGAGITLTESAEIARLHEDAEALEGKLVRIEGTVAEVCPRRGCWVEVVDATNASIRVKVDDGVIVFPLSAKGERIVVEGTLEKVEMTEDEARAWREHEAKEMGEEFDPTSVTGAEIMWRIRGTGAEISS